MILTFSGGGYTKSLFSTEGVSALRNRILEAFQASGWGVDSFSFDWSSFNFSPYLYYVFTVNIISPDNENAGRVQRGVFNVISHFLDEVTVYQGQAKSVATQIGEDIGSAVKDTVDGAAGAGGATLGLSTGVLIALGIGAVLVLTQMSPSKYIPRSIRVSR